jgi:hypothetical protein
MHTREWLYRTPTQKNGSLAYWYFLQAGEHSIAIGPYVNVLTRKATLIPSEQLSSLSQKPSTSFFLEVCFGIHR